MIASAKKGHAAVHGTDAEKKVKAQKMQLMCMDIAKANPRWGITSILKQAGEKLGCSEKTIRRNIPGLKDILGL